MSSLTSIREPRPRQPSVPAVRTPKEQAQSLLQALEANQPHTALTISQKIAMAQVYATLHLAEVVSEGGVHDSMVAI